MGLSSSGQALYELPKRRPSVPEFQFRPPTTDLDAGRVICSNCEGQNRVGARFCMTCGQALALADAAAPEAPPPTESDPSVEHGSPIAPMPMLAIGSSQEPEAEAPAPASPPSESPMAAALPPPSPPIPADAGLVRMCARCRGMCDASAAFCKFCGASLTDPTRPSDAGRISEAASPKPGPDRKIELPKPEPKPALAATSPILTSPRAPSPAGGQPSAPPLPPATPIATPPMAGPSSPPAPSPGLMAASITSRPSAPRPAAEPAPSSGEPKPSSQGKTEPMARGRLVIIAKDGGEGQSYPIAERLDIGRTEGDVLLADDRYLSPRHARLLWQRDELVLRDLGSVNGVFLRLSKSQTPNLVHPLRDQDLILIGQQVIRFEIVKDAEEGLGPAMQHGTLLFGTPAAPRHARLSQRTVEGVTRDVFHVRKVETVLGRELGDIVFTEDPFLSRRHAVIKLDTMRKTFTIADLGSSNGTFLQIRGDAVLKSGDEFRVGQQLFRVELSPSQGAGSGAGSANKIGPEGGPRKSGNVS